MKLDLNLKMEGEFRAVVHTGHTIDADGNELHGEVLRESTWGHNLITALGMAAQLSGLFSHRIVVGSGNSVPTIGDTALEAYKGSPSVQAVVSRTVNTTPDAEGYCTITTIYRATFNPGKLGVDPINISEAGTAMSSTPNASTNLYSRGLIVDDFGDPLSISLNPAVEYLDIYWKYVRYIPAEISGTQVIKILGVDVVHNYVVRPYSLVDLSDTYQEMYWGNMSSSNIDLPYFSPSVSLGYEAAYGPRLYDGEIGTITTNPSGTFVTYKNSSWSTLPYVAGSFQRKCSLNLIPTEGNLVSGIKTLTLGFGLQGWQIQFTPVIMKNATPQRVLRLDFTITLANK